MKYLLSFLLGVFLTSMVFLFYLKNKLGVMSEVTKVTTEQTIDAEAPAALPDGFRTFYEKFHQDSAYQMAHIRFPLEGIPEREEEDTNLKNFYWEKENWTIHKGFNAMEGAFIRDFQPIGKDLVIEKIRHASANFGMQRRWSRDGEDWFLIYYAAMNELAQTE